MHDFICCEEVPVDGLTSSDLATPLHTLLYGPQYLSLSPDHLLHTTVEVRCKSAVSRMDLLNSCGGTIATAPIPLPGLTEDISARWRKLKQCLKSVINIDACEIRYGIVERTLLLLYRSIICVNMCHLYGCY